MFCSCKFIILGRSPAKVDHCNSPSCILKGNIAHPPSCIHLLHLCQNCLETLQIGISSMKVGPRNICPKIMSMHFNIQRHISCPALRSFSMRWGSISGAKAISYKAYKKNWRLVSLVSFFFGKGKLSQLEYLFFVGGTQCRLQGWQIHSTAILQLHGCMNVVDGMPRVAGSVQEYHQLLLI